MDAILDDPVAQVMKIRCWKVMENAPKRTKGPTSEGADDEYSYRTLQSSQWPCLCTYSYAGIQRHEIYQHAAPTDKPVGRTRAPKAGRIVQYRAMIYRSLPQLGQTPCVANLPKIIVSMPAVLSQPALRT